MRGVVLFALFTVFGCTASEDPGDGGFFAGLNAISDGIYEQRITDRETAVNNRREKREEIAERQDELDAEAIELAAELDRLTSEHRKLKRRIVDLRLNLAERNVALNRQLNTRIASVVAQDPERTSPSSDRLDALRKAINDARDLAEDLSRISL